MYSHRTVQRSAGEIFSAAMARSDAADRREFLDEACGNDAEFRSRMEALLSACHARSPNPLDAIVVAFGAEHTLVAATESGPAVHAIQPREVGPYKLLEQIGQGGFGTVYMADQTTPVKRRVALKILKPGMDTSEVIARFEAERQALAMMDHPHIARVLDGGTSSEGRPYFVMELVRGVPITEYCDEARLTNEERLRLFVDVCRAIQHAHLKGLIHRDLKPSNVLVTMHDDKAVAKVIDFGIAKAVNQKLTERTLFTGYHQLLGTPMYMSPEQAQMSGIDVDTRSDVYSLGVLLYELLTGSTPFTKESLSNVGFDELRRIIREQEPARPSTRLTTLDAQARSTIADRRRIDQRQISNVVRGELDWIVMKALEKNRTRRYESASALAADVERYLGDEPVQACPPSIQYRLSKFVRRHRSRVLSTGLIGCGALVLAVVYWQGELERQGRESQAIQAIDSALASAKAALAARNVSLAEQFLAEARAGVNLTAMDQDEFSSRVAVVQGEVDQVKVDEEQFSRFIRMARQTIDELSYSGEFMAQKKEDAHATLNFYGILHRHHWMTALQKSHITEPQKIQVREAAFELLIVLADSMIRWREFRSESTAREGHRYLDTALEFHEPTKVVHWIRKELHTYLKEDDEAEVANALYEATAATITWDWYLPGHSAGWAGNRPAARDAYLAVLQKNPSHFNSLFFLGARYETDSMYPEAIAYFTACIALRPDHVYARNSRAEVYEKTGDLGRAEADYLAALKCDAPPAWKIDAYKLLLDFYIRTNQFEMFAPYAKTLAHESESLIEIQSARTGAESLGTLRVMSNLGGVLWNAGDFQTPLVWLKRTQEGIGRIRGSEHHESMAATRNLGFFLVDAGRYGEGLPLLEEALKLRRLHLGEHHADTLDAMTVLGRSYAIGGRLEEAVPLLEDAYTHIESAGKETPLSILEYLSGVYGQQENWDKAASVQMECLERHKASLGAEHAKTLHIMRNLGFLLIKQGNHASAIDVLAEALEIHRRLKKHLVKEADMIVINLAVAYSRAGQVDEARRVLSDQQELVQQSYGAVELAGWQAYTVDQLLGAEAYNVAEQMAEQCLRAREELLPGTWQFYNAQSLMGGVRLGQSKLDKAEELLLDAITGLESQRATIPLEGLRNISNTLKRLVALYKAKDDLEELARWEERLQQESTAAARLPRS